MSCRRASNGFLYLVFSTSMDTTCRLRRRVSRWFTKVVRSSSRSIGILRWAASGRLSAPEVAAVLMHIGVGKRKVLASQQSVLFSGRLSGNVCMILFNRCFYRVIRVQVPRGIFLIRRSLLFIVSGLVGSPYRQQKGIFPDIAAVGLLGSFSFASFHGFVIVVADTSLQLVRNFT